MTTGIAQYLTLYKGSTVFYRWQNYYANKNVTLSGQSYGFLLFQSDGIETGNLQTESTLSITFPAINSLYSTLLRALRNAYSVRIETYAFDPKQGNTSPQLGQIKVGTYDGEIINAQRSIIEFTIELGASLSPVGSQVPPRKLTSRLIGVPCRLN